MQSTYGEKEIISLLDRARAYNKGIGEYKMFTVTENSDYEVLLSNGKILLRKEELPDDVSELSIEDLYLIARRFIKDKPHTKTSGPDFIKPIILSVALLVFVFCIVSGIIGLSKHVNSSKEEPETYDENVISDENSESKTPTDFLVIDKPYKDNIADNEFVINVDFVNNATTETYHNAVIKITYFTDTDDEIGSECVTVNEVFPPNSTKSVELQVNKYDNASSVNLELIRVKSR
jgi:hypothetical protein